MELWHSSLAGVPSPGAHQAFESLPALEQGLPKDLSPTVMEIFL